MQDNTIASAFAVTQAIEQLADDPTPYAPLTPASLTLFQEAMKQADEWHCARNPVYAALYDACPEPVLPVSLFKRDDLATQPVSADDDTAESGWLTSSGSGQQGKTSVFFDALSLSRIQRGMTGIFQEGGLISGTPSRFLLLSPDPSAGSHPGYATAFLKFTQCAPVRECVFAIAPDGKPDMPLAWETLQRWAESPEPVYIFGLTVWFEYLALSAPDAPLTFQSTVKGITGGGWKGMTQRLNRDDIIEKLQQTLHSAGTDIRDIYGMTEHPLHYISCPAGHFHQPAFSRFSVIGQDGNPAPDGVQGLIQLENPFFAALPSHRLLTEDSGMTGTGCLCGSPLPYLRYLGRVTSPDGTCAAGTL